MEQLLIRVLNALTPGVRRLFNRRRIPSPKGWSIGTATTLRPGDSPEDVSLDPNDLRRHVYLLGASGSGKTKALELLIRAHIRHGLGFCVVDPHGDLTRSIAAYLLDQSQRVGPDFLDRVYLVEPFTDEVAGMNVLNPGRAPLYPHISELVSIFRRLWLSSWGPRMEETLRNALLVLAQSGYTLVEVPALLTDAAFRAKIIEGVPDAALRAYWQDRFEQLSDAARLTYSEPVLNKLGALTADPRVRAMLGQREHCLDFRKLMDDGAWILLNVSKGHLRDASYLLGSLATAQIQAAAMSRSEIRECDRRPFTLFVDEFQNFRGEDFETILCEARKYALRIVVAHQHLGQLDAGLQNAIFGNVATQLIFAVSPPDAAVLGRLLSGDGIRAEELTQLPVGQAVFHQRGRAAQRIQVHPVLAPPIPDDDLRAFMERLRRQHSRPLGDVEAEIASRATTRNTPPKPRRSPRPKRTAESAPEVPPVTEVPSSTASPVSEADDD